LVQPVPSVSTSPIDPVRLPFTFSAAIAVVPLADDNVDMIPFLKEFPMATPVYQMIELVGTSATSIEDAVNNALTSKAAQKHTDQRWVQVLETRGAIKNGKVNEWQVTVKVGMKAEA
jgi:dodecin